MRTARVNPEVKRNLCEVAQRLMLEKGFPATSVEEICQEAGVTKGSFFHYFDSKEGLGKELLERYIARRMEKDAVVRQEPDPLKRVFDYLDMAVSHAADPETRRGSLMGTFAHDLSKTYPDIATLCRSSFERWIRQFKADLIEAQALHPPAIDFDAASLCDFFISVAEGSHVLAKVHPDSPVLENSMRHFRAYVHMLFKCA